MTAYSSTSITAELPQAFCIIVSRDHANSYSSRSLGLLHGLQEDEALDIS